MYKNVYIYNLSLIYNIFQNLSLILWSPWTLKQWYLKKYLIYVQLDSLNRLNSGENILYYLVPLTS